MAESKTKSQVGEEVYEISRVREYIEALVMAVILALFIRYFVVQAFKIPSGSMEPTLLVGDYLLVNKFLYGVRIPYSDKRMFAFNGPQREDVIVFEYPGQADPAVHARAKRRRGLKNRVWAWLGLDTTDFIKRVKGLPGETIEVRNRKVFINGEMIDDPHAHFAQAPIDRDGDGRIDQAGANFGPFEIPEGQVFVMGDNRDHSNDSRFWGTVPVENIHGKAFVLYYSRDRQAGKIRWSRIFDRIP